VKRSLALLTWRLPVIWVAGDEPPAQLTATAETTPAPVVNHYHLHLEPGAAAEGLTWPAPPIRDVVEYKED
jgi:hypothetical protein